VHGRLDMFVALEKTNAGLDMKFVNMKCDLSLFVLVLVLVLKSV
jgi:hypothetical protein